MNAPHPLRPWLAGTLIVLAALAAYANTFSVPFVFDDKPAIVNNPSIRHLWPLSDVLSPPASAAGATGRPLVNLSLAVNYALGGLHVGGYHALNLLFHLAAGLTLFGLVHRTLQQAVLRGRFGAVATPLAFFTALLWTVHPLLTESVTCIVQRNESMMALCYMMVLYGVVRAADASRPHGWLAVSFTACLLGMLCKESMVSAPLAAFAFQAVLIDGSWRTAWRKRGKFFLLLALTWVPLVLLVAGNSTREGTVGFQLGVTSWEYALTQCRALIRYLALSFWPHPLVLDYGTAVVRSPAEVWWQGLGVLGLLAATAVAGWRRSPAFFPALVFWAVLAPSSSFLPLTTQTMAEHRMYLPLASVVVLAVMGAYAFAGRRSLVLFGVLAVVLMVVTVRRNHDYRSELSIWRDTVAQMPGNARALTDLGSLLSDAGETAEALRHTERALELDPRYAAAHYNYGVLLEKTGRRPEAITHYQEALRLEPFSAQTHYNLGLSYVQLQRWAEAGVQLAIAAQLDPDAADIQNNLANVLVRLGRHAEAVPRFETALRATPEVAGLHFNLAAALAYLGRTPEAIARFERGLQLEPDNAEAGFRLGRLLMTAGRTDDAIARYRTAVRLAPQIPEARFALCVALLQTGRRDEARTEAQTILRQHPDFTPARELLQQMP